MEKVRFVKFEVEGRDKFPLDMLRYDACWPYNGAAVAGMADMKPTRKVVLYMCDFGGSGPTVNRWKSFGWNVNYSEVCK